MSFFFTNTEFYNFIFIFIFILVSFFVSFFTRKFSFYHYAYCGGM